MSIKLKGIIKSIRIDEWGESTLTFNIPQTNLKEVNQLLTETQKVLSIAICKDEKEEKRE